MNLPDSKKLLEKTAALLEFDRVREAAASRALSAEAAENIRAESPLFDGERVRERKKSVSAFCDLLKKGGEENREELPAVGFLLPALAVEGSFLDADEILALGLFIERGEELRRFILESRDEKNRETAQPDLAALRDIASGLPDCSAKAAEIFRILDRDGKVRDLPEIKKIRNRIQELSKDLERITGHYKTDESTRHMLQSVLPSQRDGRIVLAVKANYRGRIKGIVHEVSATGQTLFVEPEESVEKNNQILIEKAALDAEIRRLLRELTAALALSRDELTEFHRTVVYLETIRARARYALETNGVFAGEGPLVLKGARHPLLGQDAVPIDLCFDPHTKMVIITGPNTGGKTVSLKTAGLFALMNQSGLALPAAEAALPVFDGVYADIGDEQSLSQSLSTFSAHMTSIAAIIGAAGEQSLVLLDELGAGTDPEEGSAIAMAILDHFIETKTTVILTTHHGMLKNYGYSREGVENASVEFDRRTLSPTYRIIMGIPGESRAVDIAARNGFPPPLVEKARSYLDEERSDVSLLIAGLKEKHRELDTISRFARAEEDRLREDRRRIDLKELTLRQKEYLLKQGGAAEFRRLLGESRKTLENLVREIREGELSREKTLKVKEFLKQLETGSDSMEAALRAEGQTLADFGMETAGSGMDAAETAGMPKNEITAGAEVLAGPFLRRGKVLRRDNRADKSWIVEIGSVKMTFPEAELFPAPAETKHSAPSEGAAGFSGSAGGSGNWAADLTPAEVQLELKLLGMRLEEALEALRRQVDAAVLAGLGTFAVIHGKGDGILQKGVHEYLKNDPAVADYYFSRPELGGTGRTEVVLA
ncbi:endonuclease MutS2 [Spirochaetia bacterium]|nr:endonuclease MutS2 [Spirochaetia bacterium]